MSRHRTGPTAVLLALTVLVLLAWAPGASAAGITSTQITSPADGSYFLEDRTAPTPEMTVEGTVVGKGELELRCYSAKGTSTEVGEVTEEEIVAKKFAVKVLTEEIGEEPCVLRAVPTGEKASLPPGTSSVFEGPQVAFSEFAVSKDAANATVDGYYAEDRTLTSLFEIDAAGMCGLGPTSLVSSPSLALSLELFRCAGALSVRSGATRAAIQVAGRNAYDPYTAGQLYATLKPAGTAPATTVTKEFNSATGLMTIKETEPLVECSGAATAYPETKESCEKFISAGVTLERTWTPSHEGRLFSMSDVWRSTDSAPHPVSALYAQETGREAKGPSGTYEFPGGQSAFATTKTGETVALSAGEGAILYREDGAAEEAIGSTHTIGAIIFAAAPGAPAQVTAGSAETEASASLQMPYSFEVTASSPHTLTMAFAQAYTLHEVCVLAEAAGSGCQPSVAITSPAGGATHTPSMTVSGTASDPISLASVTVNGKGVPVTEGKWSTTLALTTGPNPITAVAVNQAGVRRSATTSITYTPNVPPAPPVRHPVSTPPPVAATAALSGPVTTSRGNVIFHVICRGAEGTFCSLNDSLTTLERQKKGRLIGLLARIITRQLTVATGHQLIFGGREVKVTLKLNALGKELLKRFHRLPAHLTVTLRLNAKASTAISKNVVVTAPATRPRRRRHRRKR